MTCQNCDENGAHFCPPSLGDAGFFVCHGKDCALRADGQSPEDGYREGCTCSLSKPIPRSR